MKGCISRFRTDIYASSIKPIARKVPVAASAAPAVRSQGIIMASGSASFAVDEVAFFVEVIVKRGVDR